jgi:hypothetical protein
MNTVYSADLVCIEYMSSHWLYESLRCGAYGNFAVAAYGGTVEQYLATLLMLVLFYVFVLLG